MNKQRPRSQRLILRDLGLDDDSIVRVFRENQWIGYPYIDLSSNKLDGDALEHVLELNPAASILTRGNRIDEELSRRLDSVARMSQPDLFDPDVYYFSPFGTSSPITLGHTRRLVRWLFDTDGATRRVPVLTGSAYDTAFALGGEALVMFHELLLFLRGSPEHPDLLSDELPYVEVDHYNTDQTQLQQLFSDGYGGASLCVRVGDDGLEVYNEHANSTCNESLESILTAYIIRTLGYGSYFAQNSIELDQHVLGEWCRSALPTWSSDSLAPGHLDLWLGADRTWMLERVQSPTGDQYHLAFTRSSPFTRQLLIR